MLFHAVYKSLEFCMLDILYENLYMIICDFLQLNYLQLIRFSCKYKYS